ncbi:hydrolase 2, exosortase A system-associated [Janthinobacterium sp.]|uniref:hydrolase 2, exosortase A system-associated n=1 Tax=Janthinobacterium sp. TaxID=1871054 RepID=UPI00293D9592|nr:hydrolase 2, exosortase A system-associated [Janthinobacterium sp.]
MSASAAAAPRPFFLPAAEGQRFCLYHAAAGDCRGALLYVPPFGEEMHKARRMAALQARALAASGIAVLQLDLHGCGDSAGEFREARWETWRDDVGLGMDWLAARCGAGAGLWGLRLGALLALDYAARAALKPSRLILWQPVHNGAAFLTQFLRLRTAGAMLGQQAPAENGTAALRATLRAGQTVEVAGYELAPPLAAALDALELARLAVDDCPLHWFDIAADAARGVAPASAAALRDWAARGVHARHSQLSGPPFWATQEISVCPTLLAATTALFSGAAHAV